jgi:Ca2+-binding RTX toxin-like protein
VTSVSITWVWSSALGADGSLYVTGWPGRDFEPTPGALDEGHVLVARVDPTGRLSWAALVGGVADSQLVFSDDEGFVYLSGFTEVPNAFPTTPGALARNYDKHDGVAFLMKLSPDGSDVVWSTLLPGVARVFDADIDSAGRLRLVGEAYRDLPVTPGAFDATADSYELDGFVGTVSPDGSRYVDASFFGGIREDTVSEVEVADDGSTYVAGSTTSPDFPTTPGSFDPTFNASGTSGSNIDAFVAKIAPGSEAISWSTFLGGTQTIDAARGLAVTRSGVPIVTGETENDDFPTTPDALFADRAGRGFITQLSADGASVEYSSFLPTYPSTGPFLDRDEHVHVGLPWSRTIDQPDPGELAFFDIEFDHAWNLDGARFLSDLSVQDAQLDLAGTWYLAMNPASESRNRDPESQGAAAATRSRLVRLTRCTIHGTPGDDVITGTPGPDIICAGRGDDVVRGRGGWDVVLLGEGADRASGDGGVDVVVGGGGPDRLEGGMHRDLLRGGPGGDRIAGGSGPDSLYGGGGRDDLRGDRGVDDVHGGPGVDEIQR